MDSSRSDDSSSQAPRRRMPVAQRLEGRARPTRRPVRAAALPAPTQDASPNVSERMHNRGRAIHWWRDRLRESPSLLTSLIIHLAILVMMGCFLVPEADKAVYRLLIVGSMQPAAPKTEKEAQVQLVADAPVQAVEAETAPESEPVEPTPVPPVPPPSAPAEATGGEAVAENSTQPAVAPQGNLIAARQAPTQNAFDQFVNQMEESRTPNSLDDRGEIDDVVDRFIEYDVGRLTGTAGKRAAADFNRLGRSSIPALVRGLNKSAYIRSSCPVIELANKLRQVSSGTRNPEMINYIMDNLGKGVARNAPHGSTVLRLRRDLQQQFGYNRERAKMLYKRAGLEASDERIKAMEGILLAEPAAVVAQLPKVDQERQLASLIVLYHNNFRGLNSIERVKLGQYSAKLLDEGDSTTRILSQRVMERLTKHFRLEDDVLPTDPNSSEDWKRTWSLVEEIHVHEPAAFNQLRMAETLHRRGRFDAAEKRYRKIMDQYPRTNAAKMARSRLKEIQ